MHTKMHTEFRIILHKKQRERWQKHAAQKGISMTELITEFIENNIKEEAGE